MQARWILPWRSERLPCASKGSLPISDLDYTHIRNPDKNKMAKAKIRLFAIAAATVEFASDKPDYPFRVGILRFDNPTCVQPSLDPMPDAWHDGIAQDEGECGTGVEFISFRPIWDTTYDVHATDPTVFGNCSIQTFRDYDCNQFMGAKDNASTCSVRLCPFR